jgi:hypothetical protein
MKMAYHSHSSETYTFKVCIPEETRELYAIIKLLALNNNAMIFGGYIRDGIQIQHYSRLYSDYVRPHLNKKNYKSNYWNKSFHKVSSPRMIIPNDIDIFFNEYKNMEIFLLELKNKFKEFDIFIPSSISSSEERITYAGSIISEYISIKKCNISYKVGKSILNEGIKIVANFDLIYPISRTETLRFEPPFYNPDLLCNVFVETKDNGIRLSKCICPEVNNISHIERAFLTANIMKNIINFNTYIIKSYTNQFNSQNNIVNYIYYDINRYIKKLTNPEFPWTINNLPYNIVNISDVSEYTSLDKEEVCCICQGCISQDKYLGSDEKEEIALIDLNDNKNDDKSNISILKLHNKCLLKYINHQVESVNVLSLTEKMNFKIITPFKTEINFHKCCKNVKWYKLFTF